MLYAALSALGLVATIGVFFAIKARHPGEKDKFAWAVSEEIVGRFVLILVAALIGGLIFLTFYYS